ncbi:MAG: hypothetical protein U9Q62_03730 [Campylobacterota bacterium]|nr:hypothetical protein [Campylobacterota bacterium]
MTKALLIILSCTMLLFTGCSKKEFKTNWGNVKGGTKNVWHKTKDAVGEGTEQFAESTK